MTRTGKMTGYWSIAGVDFPTPAQLEQEADEELYKLVGLWNTQREKLLGIRDKYAMKMALVLRRTGLPVRVVNEVWDTSEGRGDYSYDESWSIFVGDHKWYSFGGRQKMASEFEAKLEAITVAARTEEELEFFPRPAPSVDEVIYEGKIYLRPREGMEMPVFRGGRQQTAPLTCHEGKWGIAGTYWDGTPYVACVVEGWMWKPERAYHIVEGVAFATADMIPYGKDVITGEAPEPSLPDQLPAE